MSTVHFENLDAAIVNNTGVWVFEADDEKGSWKLAGRYALKDYVDYCVHAIPRFAVGSYKIEMVECMGGVYVLIPMHLDTS